MHVLPYAAAPPRARPQWAAAVVLGALAGWFASGPLHEWALGFITSGSGVLVSNSGDVFLAHWMFTFPVVAASALVAVCSLALARLCRWPVTAVWRTALCAAALLLVFAAAAYVPLLGERRTLSVAATPPGGWPGTGIVPLESVKLWPALLAGAFAVVVATFIVLGLRRLARRSDQ